MHYAKKNKYELALVLFLTASALVLYLYRISEITPGMWADEIAVAIGAENTIKLNSFLPFTSSYIGHPTPLLYVTGLAIHLFGKTMEAIRIDGYLFGALSVGAMYIFLRNFYDKSISVICTILFGLCYPFIAISRFAYDTTAFIFMEIITLLVIYLSYSKKRWQYIVLLGATIGIGLYSYYAYRLFAVLFLFLGFFAILVSFPNQKLKMLFLLVTSFFITSILYFSYGINHPEHILSRTSQVFVFSQGFSFVRTVSELLGNIKNDFGALIAIGDPNPRHNPSGVAYFDIVTVVIYLIGLISLVKKNRLLFWISIIIFITALLNDILTVEIFPDFHFYGTGHPNTLRISGIIPIVFFLFAAGLNMTKNFLSNLSKSIGIIFVIGISLFIGFINLYRYFAQPEVGFTYKYNGVAQIKLAKIINEKSIKVISVSKSLFSSTQFSYFLNPSVKMRLIKLNSVNDLKEPIEKTDVFIDPLDNLPLLQNLASTDAIDKFARQFQLLSGPWKETDWVVFSNTKIDYPSDY